MLDFENKSNIFEFYPPKNKYIGFVSIPHSGLELPEEFSSYLVNDPMVYKQDVDFEVHQLVDIQKLQANGIAVVKSNIIRTAVDLNRSPELAVLAWKDNSKGKQVVKKTPAKDEIQRLLNVYYHPYYEFLKNLNTELQSHMCVTSFVDLHSMPSVAEEYHMKYNPNQDRVRPDFCLSDISGQSCEQWYIDIFTTELEKYYDNCKQNNPYFGGYITKFAHQNFKACNNIQIEISRAIYMEEQDQSLVADKVSRLKGILTQALIRGFEHSFEQNKN